MRFNELNINEYDTFQRRSTATSSSVGFGHGRDVAKRGGSQWQQAQADADRAARDEIRAARSGSTTTTGNTSTGDTAATSDTDVPNNPGTDGEIRFASGALTTLNGQQSSMTTPAAAQQMQATLARARRMAGYFGSTITINDAIAKRGTSRETQTQGSQHFHGNALDISTANMSDADKLRLVNAAQRAGFTGFGFGNSILHVDTGPRRHWSYGNSNYGGVSVASLGRAVRANQIVGSGTAVA